MQIALIINIPSWFDAQLRQKSVVEIRLHIGVEFFRVKKQRQVGRMGRLAGELDALVFVVSAHGGLRPSVGIIEIDPEMLPNARQPEKLLVPTDFSAQHLRPWARSRTGSEGPWKRR